VGESEGGAAGAQSADPGQRGRLDIAARVVERIATAEATSVPGVATTGSALAQVVGRQYPKASAEVAGARTRVDVDVAIAWPFSLAEVTAAVRTVVNSRVRGLAGLEVDAVNVTAAKIVHTEPEQPRRVQ